MPLIIARISAPTAPMPAPSVGVHRPSQIEPSVPRISATTSIVENSILRNSSSLTSAAAGVAAAPTERGIGWPSRVSPTSAGLSLAAITT